MFDHLPALSAVFALIAAAIHLFIFVLEAILIRGRYARRTFGIRSEQDAAVIAPWAVNQGFYNLFLALGAVIGVILAATSDPFSIGAGIGMVLLSTGSMVAAAVVLIATNPKLLRGALIQGLAPLVAIVALVIG